jgi:hypothetical protein
MNSIIKADGQQVGETAAFSNTQRGPPYKLNLCINFSTPFFKQHTLH